jgi:hypothetical protein
MAKRSVVVWLIAVTVITVTATTVWAKKRNPGTLAPNGKQVVQKMKKPEKQEFIFGRDPFKQPTEVLPSSCPPSAPLCRFDRSQLKCVGIIQVRTGGYKAMVEDPDGRGYFIIPGMKVGNGTVMQVTRDGAVIHLHKERQDILLPLSFPERKQL